MLFPKVFSGALTPQRLQQVSLGARTTPVPRQHRVMSEAARAVRAPCPRVNQGQCLPMSSEKAKGPRSLGDEGPTWVMGDPPG